MNDLQVEGALAAARADLADLHAIIPTLHDMAYDRPPPPEIKRRPSSSGHSLWLTPTVAHDRYMAAARHLRTAVALLADATPLRWSDPPSQLPSPPYQLHRLIALLAGGLAVLPAGKVAGVADEIAAAIAAIPKDWRTTNLPQVRRCRRAGCEGPDGQPRPMGRRRGKVCAACEVADRRRAARRPA